VSNEQNDIKTVLFASRLIGVGFYIGGSIVGGVLIGRWIDNKLDTPPFFALTGLIVGLAIAFYGVYEMLIPLIKQRRRR
jgi:ATP synthase protein I